MNDPSLYLKQDQIGKTGSRDVLQKYFHLVSQKENENEEITFIDIGCGPGNVTHDTLIPLFKNPIRKVVGIDVMEKTVQFANATYGNEKLSFEVLNIGNTVPDQYISFFDYVFSFSALQWVKDQRQLFLNINRIMKPNGQILLSFIAQSVLYDIYQSVWRRPEYAPYITDVDLAQSIFQKSKEPVKEFRAIMEGAGFDVGMVKMDTIEAKYKSLIDFKEFLISLNPYYDKMPEDLKENFILHHLELIERDTEVESPNNFFMKFNIFVAYAKKK